MTENQQLTFLTEWLEPLSTVPRKFVLSFHPRDNSVALFDISKKRYFLSRTICNTVTQPNLFIGNTINVLSRQLTITGYGDNITKTILEHSRESSLVVLMPRAFHHLGQFLDKLFKLKAEVKNLRMVAFTEDDVEYLQKWSPKSEELSRILLESPVICVELLGEKLSQWRTLDFEIPDFSSNVYSSNDKAKLRNELGLLFNANKLLGSTTARFKTSACLIIKPHAVNEGHSGKIIEALYNKNFTITALQMFYLTVKEADEFLEVYKGIISDYESVLEELASGPCLVMEVQGPNQDTIVQDLKQIVGPSDPAMARTIRRDSLRARFGVDKARNAVHCTDLPEDGELEVEYFFKLLVLK